MPEDAPKGKKSLIYIAKEGFTLIEMSIVLVIIGLIVGGILVGQDLIKGAAIQAQIVQIQKYQTAALTFRNKYGGIPGDLQSNLASQFGLTPRSGAAGRGDGNGELDGFFGATVYSWNQNGENLFFWEDLSSAGLIDGTFNAYVDGSTTACNSSAACSIYFPAAKIGGGNFLYTYSGYAAGCCAGNNGIGPNFFGIAIINAIGDDNVAINGGGPTNPGLKVVEAYAIDKKIDDGLPTKGKVMAQYLTSTGGNPGWSTNGTTPTASTCYDTSSGTAAYSTSATGNNMNCGLSFQFQH